MGKKIAVLGGSFNPPHCGHLMVASEVLRHFDCDEVWLMPCFKHAEEKPTAPARERLAMTRIAVKTLKNKRVKASDLEIRFLKKKNYTADTVMLLKKRFPQHVFSWIFGSELLKDFPHWGKWNALRTMLPLVIYPRPGFKKPSKKFLESLEAKLVLLPSSVKKSSVSSTRVRKMLLEKNVVVKNLIPPRVFSYIREKGLYGWKD